MYPDQISLFCHDIVLLLEKLIYNVSIGEILSELYTVQSLNSD